MVCISHKYIVMIKLWTKFNVLVNSSCNFLCDKLFHRPEIGFSHRRNDSSHYYGKRPKLSDDHWDVDFLNSKSRCLMSMQKGKFEISDDEDECLVIAEIPRRKKPENSLSPTSNSASYKDDTTPRKQETIANFSFKRDSPFRNDEKEIEQVKVISNTSGKDALSKTHVSRNRFFKTQRSSVDHGKVMKFRSLKHHLRRKMNFLQESYRLTEKLQYLQLLRSQTSCNLVAVKPTPPKITYRVSPIPVIDLTDEKPEKIDESAISKHHIKSSDDQDIQFLGQTSGVKSFEHMLQIRALKSEEAIKELLPGPSKNNFKLSDLNGKIQDTISLLDDDDDDSNEDSGDKNRRSLKSGPEALEEKLRNYMQITGPVVQEVDHTLEDQYYLPELSREQEDKIKRALIPHPREEVLVRDFGIQITRQDMQTLMGLNWLNDEIINFYMNLLMERSRLNKKLPKVYAFNTFFYSKLSSTDYSCVRRWTKQVDIFSFDIILVPIHLGMHWCMSAIDFRSKSIQYYDSIGSPNAACLERLMMYLRAESLDKKKKIFCTNDWEKSNAEDIPQQMNGSDCGVFSCMFAEHLARDCAFLFTQDDMPYFRKKMIIEILNKRLLT